MRFRTDIDLLANKVKRVCLEAIAGIPAAVWQFGINAISGRARIAVSAAAFRDLAFDDRKFQTVTAGTSSVLPDFDIVLVNNGTAIATVRLPIPADYVGRTVCIKRANSTASGTLRVTCVNGAAVIENATGQFVTQHSYAVALRFASFCSDGARWHRVS